MAPKKNVKMDLSSFLADDTFGTVTDSWADDFDPTMLQNSTSTVELGIDLPSAEPAIPEEPPFTARIASFPDGTTEEELRDFFFNGLNLTDADVEDFYCPRDHDGSLKTFAFITFPTRDLLIEALALNDQPIHNKPVYVSVAKPSKRERTPRGSRFGNDRYQDDSMLDWGEARGARGSMQQREPRERRGPPREDSFEWGAARGSMQQPEPAERSFRGPPRERRGPPREDSFEWGAARGSMQQPEPAERSFRGPPRERKPREDNFEWGAARGSMQQPEPAERSFRGPPRERKPREDSFEWGAARGSMQQPEPAERSFKNNQRERKPKEDTFEWGARGSMLKKQNETKQAPTPKKEAPVDGPKKSMFSVLQNDDEDDDEEEQEETKTGSESKDSSDDLAKATADLSLNTDDTWTTIKN